MHLARSIFKHPVATQGCVARGIVRGRYVRARQFAQACEEGPPLRTVGKRATVEQHVRVSRQVRIPPADGLGAGLQGPLVQLGGAYLYGIGAGVGQDVHGIHRAVRSQGFGDLIDAIALPIEHNHLDVPAT